MYFCMVLDQSLPHNESAKCVGGPFAERGYASSVLTTLAHEYPNPDHRYVVVKAEAEILAYITTEVTTKLQELDP